MTYVSETLRRLVAERAHHRCEYCKLPENDSYASFQIDHIIATKHGGKTTEANLCLSCANCNGHKGSDLASLDPRTEKITLLFNPRTDQWTNHFKMNGAYIEGLTSEGRATARLLQFNARIRLRVRELLLASGQWDAIE
ncbi:MAG: HNH endonuclease [Anaerolineae bacterium]|nr:HNH endonuclease [Anaerolineae bacterium]